MDRIESAAAAAATLSDDEYEEEEIIVYADFHSKIPFDTLTDPNLNIKLIGMETDHPLMQINSKVFQGM